MTQTWNYALLFTRPAHERALDNSPLTSSLNHRGLRTYSRECEDIHGASRACLWQINIYFIVFYVLKCFIDKASGMVQGKRGIAGETRQPFPTVLIVSSVQMEISLQMENKYKLLTFSQSLFRFAP